MSTRTPVRQPPLTQQVREILIEQIDAGLYPPGSKLPPESELASDLSVSRATIRTALGMMAARGLVVRRQGAGTFVSQLSRIFNPLNIAIDFQELIANYGFKPGVQHVATLTSEASDTMAEALQIKAGEPVLESHKVFTADGEAVIYCVNTLALGSLDEALAAEVLGDPDVIEPIYDFFELRCDQRIEYHHSKLYPAIAEDCMFHGGLPLDRCAPVLVIDGAAYDVDEDPLFHTYEYHHHPENLMSLEIVRLRSQ